MTGNISLVVKFEGNSTGGRWLSRLSVCRPVLRRTGFEGISRNWKEESRLKVGSQ